MVSELIQKAAESLLAADDILILTHIRPDGDTLGSAAALKHALNKLGKNSQVCNDDEPSKKYSVIAETIKPGSIDFVPGYIVAVDTATVDLLREDSKKLAEKADLVIDHHGTNSFAGGLRLVFTEVAACGEIIYHIILAMGIDIDIKIARCLYTALATDTGCFKYSNTTSETHYIAAKLLETGFDVVELNRRYFETKSMAQFAIENEVRNNIELHHGGRLSIFCVTLDMMERTHAVQDDLDGLSALSRQIEGVEIGVYIKQEKESEYKVSMRSHGKYNVAEICASFGGGGHPNAAGCGLNGDLNFVKAELIRKIENIWTAYSI